ncbi:protein FAM81B [Betta splendens]|uniref:Protein FAM81B n=1 Tax=Betta splendens TaxID=158456 RepID=A0A6P7NL36_BETSP|nr:protein FAM81B [Betta splendens]
MSNETRLQPYAGRADACEAQPQERTLAVLLEEALRIKEEVAAGLRSCTGSVRAQALSRQLLETHILTITRIVKRLSVDIQALERQISQRDSVTSGTTLAIQRLDQKNGEAIGDLRVRVARCDASISKLSADTSSGEQQKARLQQEVTELRLAVDAKLKEMEVKLNGALKRLEDFLTEHSRKQRKSVADLQRQVKLLEDKMSAELKKANEQTDVLRKCTEQFSSITLTHAEKNQQLRSQLQHKMSEAESTLGEQLRGLDARLQNSEAQRQQAERSQEDRVRRHETRLSKRMASVETSLRQELQLLKQEYHKGFLSVRDAIESLRQIGDIKSRLDNEKLQKDIRHICNKVAELSDV